MAAGVAMPSRAHQALRILVYPDFNKTAVVDDLSGQWTGLSFSSALHGGFKQLSMDVPMSFDRAALWLERGNLPGRHFYHIEVTEDNRIVWEGRFPKIGLRKTPTFQGIHLEAMGYWSSARDRYYSTADTNWSDSGTLVRAIVTGSCPDLNGTANIETTGLDITGFNGSARDFPQNWIIDKIAPLSTPTNGVLYFGVWENRVPYFTTRSTSSLDWQVYMQDINFLNLDQNAEHLRNAVYPVIGTADGTSTIDAESTLRYGLRREIILNVQAGVPASTANRARDTKIAEGRFPRQDSNFTVSGHAYSSRAAVGGTAVPNAIVESQKWWVRAGDVVRIQDLYPASQSTVALDDLRTFYILDARYDAVRDTVEVVPDRPQQDLQTILAQIGTLERTR